MKKVMVISILVLMLFLFYQCTDTARPATSFQYVGSEKCQSCHQKEVALFKTSDHYHAMDTVSAATVKGDFNDSRFIYNGDTAFFYQKKGQYFVRTTDTAGIKKEFCINYTFGWKPLQQYLVAFEDGRIQVLPFCWDTREKEKGGQRWFHLYDKEKIGPDDELFWMSVNQNWNYMCADCHTTNFKSNFNTAEDKFSSTWNEIRVSCESCHGPASNHIKWTESKEDILFKGFTISLAAKPVLWRMDTTKQTTLPEVVIKNDTLIETCARCHARAVRFSDDYIHGQSFLQTHLPATINSTNYYVDGQLKEEDYEYGSFLQSKMYAAGVTCNNCHDAHSMKVKTAGNALCATCHSPAKYDGPQHSYHNAAGTGNLCVNCHMPVTTYMVVDNRLDHSIRIPRPDLSVTSGTPNACNKCHADKSVQWAAANFSKWYGHKLTRKEPDYAELLGYIAAFNRKSEPSLYILLTEKKIPPIIRATALEQYGIFSSPRNRKVVIDELSNESAFIRLNAVKAFVNYPQQIQLLYLPPLLKDKVAAVRMEAMVTLAPIFNSLASEYNLFFMNVMNEYMGVQERLSHRPEGFYNRALIYNFTGNRQSAEQLYITCMQRFPGFVQAYANLSDLLREENRDVEAKKIIDRGLARYPKNAQLHYALGLWQVRNNDKVSAISEMKIASVSAPADPQIQYGYAIALFSAGRQAEAVALLEKFIEGYGNNTGILDLLISMCSDLQKTDKLNKYQAVRREVFGY